MKHLFLTRIFLVFSLLNIAPWVMAGSLPETRLEDTAAESDHRESINSTDSEYTLMKASEGLHPVFVASASLAPALGHYSFKENINPSVKNGVKTTANFISSEISVGWSFIDPRTEHFSHTILLRGNIQTTLIPGKIGGYTHTDTNANYYRDLEFTRNDQTAALSYKLGIKKHGLTFSSGYKQSESIFKADETYWNDISNINLTNTKVDNKGVVTIDTTSKPSSNVTVTPGTNAVTVSDKTRVTSALGGNERVTTNGSFVGFGYDYQINEAQNMRLGANVSYLKLKAKRQYSNSSDVSNSTNGKGIKWGVYLQGDAFKLDRYGKFTYTLAYDNFKYDIEFPKAGSDDDKVQEKLQTLSISINYIFF